MNVRNSSSRRKIGDCQLSLSDYAYFHGIMCNNNEQERTVKKYLGRGAVCDYLQGTFDICCKLID